MISGIFFILYLTTGKVVFGILSGSFMIAGAVMKFLCICYKQIMETDYAKGATLGVRYENQNSVT